MGKSLLGKGRSMCEVPEVPEGKEPDVSKEHQKNGVVGALCKKGRGSWHGKFGRLGLWRDSKLYSKYHGKVLKDLKHRVTYSNFCF